jgi:hypothetical protein
VLLTKNSESGKTRSIRIHKDLQVWVVMAEDWSFGKQNFEVFEGRLGFWRPLELCCRLAEEGCYWEDDT